MGSGLIIAELRERMSDVKSELRSFTSELPNEEQRVKAADALKRIDEWNLFAVPRTVRAYDELSSYIMSISLFLEVTSYLPFFVVHVSWWS